MARGCSDGALRMAGAALTANGGFDIVLRLPGTAVIGSEAEQLGLGTPQFEEITLGAAVWRKTGDTSSLLLDASGVAALVGSRGFASAKAMFQSAVDVVVDGVAYSLAGCEPIGSAGCVCAYKLLLIAPTWA